MVAVRTTSRTVAIDGRFAEVGPYSLGLFGCPLNTGNLGVSALGLGTIRNLVRSGLRPNVTLYDYGSGERQAALELDEVLVPIRLVGCYHSHRYYRANNTAQMYLASRLGLSEVQPMLRRLAGHQAILDISGGDSFTDLYGLRRFRAVVLPKLIALSLGKPLILLPQTYGPYQRRRTRRQAAKIVGRATLAYARDGRSFDAMKELLGAAFDSERHRVGVDVAFLLEPREPALPLPEAVAPWLTESRSVETIGFNVSGLIHNNPAVARDQYGLRADYRDVVRGFLKRLLAETDANIVLVPHVLTPPGHYESDVAANERVMAALTTDSGPSASRDARGRIAMIPPSFDCREMKWIIGRCDWFCGTRMHSTIAALSSGVPAAAIAYSLKTQGVFECCGQDDHVADLRMAQTDEAIWQLWQSFSSRAPARASLNNALVRVRRRAMEQMQEIVAVCRANKSDDSWMDS